MERQKRRRGKSAMTELRSALAHAAALQRLEKRDESYISDCKLVQTRIVTLTLLMNRKQGDKLGKLKGQLAEAQGEIKRLSGENETLQQELAAARSKAVTAAPSAVEEALAKYESEGETQ